MNKDNRSSTGVFEPENILSDQFWINNSAKLPTRLDFESVVHVRNHRKLSLKDYSQKWLGIANKVLYFADKHKDKNIKSINLKQISCQLYEQAVKKSKHPYKLILRHHNISMEFFFSDPDTIDSWISELRDVCLMCDFTNVYHLGNCLYKGNLAMTSWAQSKVNGESYVAKMYEMKYDPNRDELQQKIERQVVFNEIKALRALDHPNVVKLKEVHELNGVIVLVMQFIGGSTLLRHILSRGSLPEPETVYIMEILLKGLQDIHNQKILHRNLKPENVLLDLTPNGTNLKFTGFGFSCTIDSCDESSWNSEKNICCKCGTPGYMAPEILANKESTPAADIFSMGVILYTCLTGEALFRGKSIEDILYKNLEVNISKVSMKWHQLSKYAKDLITKMTYRDPKQRITLDKALEHPFFTNQKSISSSYTTNSPSSQKINYMNVPTDNDLMRQVSKNSIDESIYRKDQTADYSMGDILQSLIIPPSFLGFSKSGVLEIPPFYVNSNITDTLKTSELAETLGSEEGSRLLKKMLKFSQIKGTLSHLDPNQTTPRFHLKPPEVVVAESIGPDLLEVEEENSYDEEGVTANKVYQKCYTYTFPSINSSPFKFKNYSLPVGHTLQVDHSLDQNNGNNGMNTYRKLPTLGDPMRRVIENKDDLLEDLD